MTGQESYTVGQAAYELRKLRGENLAAGPVATTSRPPCPHHRRLLTLRDQVIAPILARVRIPAADPSPRPGTAIDRDYENLRIGMQTLLGDLAAEASLAAA